MEKDQKWFDKQLKKSVLDSDWNKAEEIINEPVFRLGYSANFLAAFDWAVKNKRADVIENMVDDVLSEESRFNYLEMAIDINDPAGFLNILTQYHLMSQVPDNAMDWAIKNEYVAVIHQLTSNNFYSLSVAIDTISKFHNENLILALYKRNPLHLSSSINNMKNAIYAAMNYNNMKVFKFLYKKLKIKTSLIRTSYMHNEFLKYARKIQNRPVIDILSADEEVIKRALGDEEWELIPGLSEMFIF